MYSIFQTKAFNFPLKFSLCWLGKHFYDFCQIVGFLSNFAWLGTILLFNGLNFVYFWSNRYCVEQESIFSVWEKVKSVIVNECCRFKSSILIGKTPHRCVLKYKLIMNLSIFYPCLFVAGHCRLFFVLLLLLANCLQVVRKTDVAKWILPPCIFSSFSK